MWPELIGVVLGLMFVIPAVLLFRRYQVEDRAWAMFLAALPMFYMLFGVLALDAQVILQEFLYGLPFILSGLLVLKLGKRVGIFVLGLAWLSHGFYDYFHDLLFVNPGVFSWYPAFCATVDIVAGLYIMIQARHIATATTSASRT